MRRTLCLSVAALAAGLLLAGCSHPEDQILGQWHIDASSFPGSNSPQTANAILPLTNAFTFDIRSNRTFTFIMRYPRQPVQSTGGHYKMNARVATLTFDAVNGTTLPWNAPATTCAMTLSDDGKSATLSSPGGQGEVKLLKSM